MKKQVAKKLRKMAMTIAAATGMPLNMNREYKRLKKIHTQSPHNNKPIR